MKITKITVGLVAVLVVTSLVCSESYAAKKTKSAPAGTTDIASTLSKIDAKTANALSKLDSRTIAALSKMDPKAIDALAKMDTKTLDAVSRMGTSGALNTMSDNPRTVQAYNNMAKATEAKRK